MNNSSPTPSTSRPRYQKIRELGRNRAGGRITYLAKDNKTQQPVVIKRFLFAQAGFTAGAVIKNYRERGFSPKIALTSSLLMTGLGMSLGIGYNFGFVNFWLLVSTIGSSLALVSLLINPYLQRRKRLEHYNQSAKKRRLIKP